MESFLFYRHTRQVQQKPDTVNGVVEELSTLASHVTDFINFPQNNAKKLMWVLEVVHARSNIKVGMEVKPCSSQSDVARLVSNWDTFPSRFYVTVMEKWKYGFETIWWECGYIGRLMYSRLCKMSAIIHIGESLPRISPCSVFREAHLRLAFGARNVHLAILAYCTCMHKHYHAPYFCMITMLLHRIISASHVMLA